jgi:hypothetical protein
MPKLVAKCVVLLYVDCVAERETKEMSAVGKKLWVHMQDKGPYNQRAFARMLDRRGILKTTHQSISNWLHKEYPAPYFVNAVVEALDLSPEEEIDLHYTYFYGEQRPKAEHWQVARRIEEEAATENRRERSVSKDSRA